MSRLRLLASPRFFCWSVGVAWLVVTLTVWLQNLPLIYYIIFSSGASLPTVLALLGNLYLGLGTNFTPLAMVTTVLIALLSGVNAGLLALYLKQTQSLRTIPTDTSLVQIGAMVSAVFGIGCASCGSIILMAVLLQLGAGGVLFLLPFHGQEFALIAVALLGYAARLLWQKLATPAVCR